MLRIYLALCVVVAHSENIFPWPMHDGRQAVQLFFIVSGFYMQYVLATSYGSVRQFYTSRSLRIFVPYFAAVFFVSAATLVNVAFGGEWLTLEKLVGLAFEKGREGAWFASLSNITLLFQDWVMFIRHDPGAEIGIVHNLWDSADPLWHYLIVPQAWSIGVELTFYLFAPFMAYRLTNFWLVAVVLVSLSLRGIFYASFGAVDPWSYRFFPFELALFGLGMLAGRVYLSNDKLLSEISLGESVSKRVDAARYSVFACLLVAFLACGAMVVAYARAVGKAMHPLGAEAALLLSYLPWLVLIPVLFALTRKSKVDRYLGEFSYPIYLLHYTVILIATPLVKKESLGEWSALVTVVLSAMLVHGLVEPFEKWRKSRVAAMARIPDQQLARSYV